MVFLFSCSNLIHSKSRDLLIYDDPLKNGIDKTKIDNFIQTIEKKDLDLHYFAVLKGNKIVSEYTKNYDIGSLHDIASVTKIIISILIGELIEDRLIHNVNDDITKYLNEFTNLKGITIKHLLTMTSGLNGYETRDLFTMMGTNNWEEYIQKLKIENTPGKKFNYNNINSHILSILITRVSGSTAEKLLYDKVLLPLNIKDFEWDKDPKGNPYGWGNLKLLPHDLLKIGYLIKSNGSLMNKTIINKQWLEESMKPYKPTSKNPFFRLDYGYAWFIPKGIKDGFYVSLGRGGQTIFIFPDKDLIIMTLGNYDISSLILKIPRLADNINTDITYYDYWSNLEGEWEFKENYFGLQSIKFINYPQKTIVINGKLLSINGKFNNTGDPLKTQNLYNIGEVESSYNYTTTGNLKIILNEIDNINTFILTINKMDLKSNKLSINIKEHQLLPDGFNFFCKIEK